MAERELAPVFEFSGAKIGFNPQDRFMMALGNTLVVVTQDGNVFGAAALTEVHISLKAIQNSQGRFIEVDGDSFTPNGVVALTYDIFTGGAPDTHQRGEQNAVADGNGVLSALIKVNLGDISGADVKAVDTASNRSAIASI